MRGEPRIGIAGVGAYLPSHVVTNEDLSRIVDTNDDWIVRRTGIRTRRILAKDEGILDMAVAAARSALDDAGVTADQIADIRVGVNTWLRFPSLATQVQEALGAAQASASDVSAGCAGFIYAMEDAFNRLFVNRARFGRDAHSLVIGVDGLSHITDWTDRNTCVLLGDGAGAVVLGPVERGAILATHTHADGRYGPMLYSDPVLAHQRNGAGFTHAQQGVRPYLHMEGRKVFGVACETMVRDVREVIAKYNAVAERPISLDEVAYIFPHQANLRIIEAAAKRLEVPLERVYTDGIARYGNTSAASIPIGYRDRRSESPSPSGSFEVDVAFGAGFASGAILRQVA